MTEADPQISTKAHSERSASDRRLQVIRTRKIWNYFWTVAFNSAIALTLVHLSAIRYDSGLANYLEVIDAQIQLYPAERSALLYDLGRKIAIVNLYRVGISVSSNGSEPVARQRVLRPKLLDFGLR